MRILALLVALLLLGALGSAVIHHRSERFRIGYRIRALLDERALIRNEVRHLQGSVALEATPVALLARCERQGLEVGERHGRIGIAPAPSVATGE
jgi:hypothetical protein